MSAVARRVEPEWLDTLPVDDRRAMRSRRDLARVNGLMANARFVADALAARLPRGRLRVVELGAGDGRFTERVLRRLDGITGEVVMVDRAPCLDAAVPFRLAKAGWVAEAVDADVFDWLRRDRGDCDAIFANLFLHHFEDAALAEMLALAAERTSLFVACEPRRSGFALAGSHLLGLIGCNDVTRHDAVASVRAGFVDGEISARWPRGDWKLEENGRGAFSHLFVARREAASA